MSATDKTSTRAAKKSTSKASGEDEVLATIATLTGNDHALAQRIHELVKEHAPALTPRLWYGMPAYAKNGKVVCFFQSAAKFKTRYATLGFQHEASLDEGRMWPVAFALTEITPADEETIATLVKRAAGE